MKTQYVKLFALEYVDALDIKDSKKLELMEKINLMDYNEVVNFIMVGENYDMISESESIKNEIIFESSQIGAIVTNPEATILGEGLFDDTVNGLKIMVKNFSSAAKEVYKNGKEMRDKLKSKHDEWVKSMEKRGKPVNTAKAARDLKKWEKANISWKDKIMAKAKEYEHVISQHKTAGKVVGVALLIAILAFAARLIYKKYYSKGAKECSGYTGPEKAECIKKFKKEALKKEIEHLKSNAKLCKGTKDPSKCIDKLSKKISKKQKELATI